jgi:hypothetical protein
MPNERQVIYRMEPIKQNLLGHMEQSVKDHVMMIEDSRNERNLPGYILMEIDESIKNILSQLNFKCSLFRPSQTLNKPPISFARLLRNFTFAALLKKLKKHLKRTSNQK